LLAVPTVSAQTVYSHTGADQTYTVPPGVTAINVKLWGAGGAREGGSGAFVSGTLAVTPGETLTIIVGGGGVVGPPSGLSASAYGGGGRAVGDTFFGPPGAGGGRSAIRRGSTELVTAGSGGGGYGANSNPGGGGGLLAGVDPPLFGSVGRGGTQTAGGSKAPDSTTATNGSQFQGGTGHNGPTFPGGPGGGSGYYGGGGGASDASTGGAGGGSSLTSNLTSFSGSAGSIGAAAGVAPGGASDADYLAGIGRGGASTPAATNGGHGRVVISLAGPPANSAPTDIALSPSSLSENNLANATVGTLTATDPNSGDTHTFTLVGGAGSTHNSSFSIIGSTLFIGVAADREVLGTYSIRVQARDSGTGNLTFEKALTVSINDVNDVTPVVTAGQSFTLAENSAFSSVVGTVAAQDGDVTPTTFSGWTILSGNTGSAFGIVPATGQIRVASSAALDFETNPVFTLGVRVSDGVNVSATQSITIQLTNVPEAPLIGLPTSANITSTTATLGGTITTDGGSAITARGVVYAPTATDADPFIGDPGVLQVPHASNGSGIFTVNISSLSAGTDYSFKAYATNGVGTAYTAVATFITGSGSTSTSGVWMGTALVSTGGPFDCTGVNFEATLGFVPATGIPYPFLHAGGGLTGEFNDLPDGGIVAMSFGGIIYYFQIGYTGTGITLTHFTPATGPEWKWVAGPQARNGAGIYGSLNVAASANNPGARQGAMNWRAPDGSLWLFGGYGYATSVTNPPRYLNDVWQYQRDVGSWVWRAGANAPNQVGVYGTVGVEAPANAPGSRHSGTTWTDADGHLWLFGGYGVGSTAAGAAPLNDLWRFNRTTGHWTWMKGSALINAPATYGSQGIAAAANTPGARSNATGFYRDGSLWLFGGYSGASHFNDLWRYEIATGDWTWVGGANVPNQNGIYGTQGVSAAGNQPGSRRDATGWAGLDGRLYLFGGLGLAASGTTLGDLSDLWRYDPMSQEWTWIKGVSTLNATGVYGTLNTPALSNLPGARSAGSGWVTADGDLWLVAGFKSSSQSFDDVWIYDISSNQWTWRHGSAGLLNQTGVYGTQGTASATNKPGGRFTPSTWVTLNGTLWIFGGGGVDAFGNTGRLGDLWSYGIPNPSGTPYDSTTPSAFPGSLIVNDEPSATDATAGTMAYVPVSGQLSGNDPDGDRVLFSMAGASNTSHGTLTLNTDGTWTYTPVPGFTGMAVFQFTAADNYGGESSVRTLRISVITNPADSDGDGIADAYEQSVWGGLATADGEGDADLDGQSNYFEFLAGTNPLDASQNLSTALAVPGQQSENGTVKLQLNHVRPGVNYHLESSGDLATWTRIGTFSFKVAGSAEIEDPEPSSGSARFYRMILEATPAAILP